MESFLSFLQCNWILFLLFTVPLKMDLFVPRTATFTIQRVRWSCWHADREWCVPSSRQDSYKIICQSNRIYFVPLPPGANESQALPDDAHLSGIVLASGATHLWLRRTHLSEYVQNALLQLRPTCVWGTDGVLHISGAHRRQPGGRRLPHRVHAQLGSR